MHDDHLRSLLRSLEDEREPDPAFAEALFNRLTLVARNERSGRAPFVLLAAALLVSLLAAGVAIGSGLIRLPMTVDASATPNPSASAIASPEPSSSAPDPDPTAPALPSPSAVPSLDGGIAYAAADGLRVRTDPSADAETIATLRAGQLMGVVGAPTAADSMVWHPVRIGPGNLAGWVAAGPEGEWLRAVEDGALTFRCDGCGDAPAVVSVTPFGDASITTLGSAQELIEWRWSPDGSRLAASRGGTTVPSHIVLLDPSGTELTDLGIGAAPMWSPDGTRLAWIGDGGMVVTDAELRPDVVDLGGLVGGAPSWSPDGSRFAVVASEDPGQIDAPVSLYVVPVTGGEPNRITDPGTINGVTWAPDGSLLGFSTVDLSGQQPSRAFIVPVDGGEPEPLFGGDAVLLPPLWSPDGTRLAAVTPEGLVLAAGDGSGAQLLVPLEDGQTMGEVRWSPSGRWLVYSTSTGREPAMWIVPADGSQAPQAVNPSGTGAQQAEWQPVLGPMP